MFWNCTFVILAICFIQMDCAPIELENDAPSTAIEVNNQLPYIPIVSQSESNSPDGSFSYRYGVEHSLCHNCFYSLIA